MCSPGNTVQYKAMYCALVQGHLIARQIDPGPSSAMGMKARDKEH